VLTRSKKLIQVREAKHELKHGTLGFAQTMSGWIIIVLWLAVNIGGLG